MICKNQISANQLTRDTSAYLIPGARNLISDKWTKKNGHQKACDFLAAI